MKVLRILLLEDSALDAELTLAALAEGGFSCQALRIETRGEFEQAIAEPSLELILADHKLPTFDGMSALEIAQEYRPELPFIFVSGTLGEEVAADALKLGATDYVVKQRMGRLAPSVHRALRETRERRDLHRAQRELRLSEDKYRILVESATDFGIVVTDPKGLVLSWAGGAEKIMGWSEAEMRGQPADRMFTPEDIAAGAPLRERRTADTKGRAEDERWHLRKDGSRFFASGVMTPIRDHRLEGFLKILRDTTERKRQEEALARINAKLRLLSDTASYLLSHASAAELITELFDKLSAQLQLEAYVAYLLSEDGASLDLLGSSNIPESVRRRITRIRCGEGVCGMVAATRRRIVVERAQQDTSEVVEVVRASGLSGYACYPLIAHSRLIGTLSFGTQTRDSFGPDELELMQTVADQIAMALDRSRLMNQEQTARREAERAREEAEAANRAKDEFLATVSHELRTPLTAMLGWARMLLGGDIDAPTLHEGLETIERNANAQAHLIEDLLDISRIITGKLRLNVRPTELLSVVNETMESLRPAADARGVAVRLVVEAASTVSGDSERLQQVVWNLLSNAIKFTPRGGWVAVTLGKTESRGTISVADSGKGMTAEFLPYVFERFRQADGSSTRRHGGLGLGLSITRHLIELHGGSIEAESDGDGKGATFRIRLPLLTEPPEAPPAHRNADPEVAPPLGGVECPSALAGLRVLVVDDDDDARRLVSAVLEKCHVEVVAVASAAEALAVLDASTPDALVSDIAMPGEDGYSLIRKVRQRSPQHGGAVPAAALTAYARAEDRTHALSAGFQRFITKPIDPMALLSTVAELAALQRA